MTKRKAPQNIEAPMIHVGATEASIAASLKAVTTVLDYKEHAPEVLVEALKCVKRACTVQNVTISNSTFTREP